MGLDLGTALVLWMLVGVLFHEFGHFFMARKCGYKTIGFFVQGIILGVIPEQPKNKTQAILTLAGGWIFGTLSILLISPFIDAGYAIIFLATALAIETFLSAIGDGVGIVHILKSGVSKTWSYYEKDVLKMHRRLERIGLSKMLITNRRLWKKLTEKTKVFPKYSVEFTDARGIRKWVLLVSLLGLASAGCVALVNWPIFWLLSWVGVKIQVDFSGVFWILVGVTLISTVLERKISKVTKNRC